MQNRMVISVHWPAGQFGYDIVYNVSVRHQLITVFGLVEFLPDLGFVEKHHSSLFRNLEFLRKLHYNARNLSIQNIIFHSCGNSIDSTKDNWQILIIGHFHNCTRFL